jgi:hypothetical protein
MNRDQREDGLVEGRRADRDGRETKDNKELRAMQELVV